MVSSTNVEKYYAEFCTSQIIGYSPRSWHKYQVVTLPVI